MEAVLALMPLIIAALKGAIQLAPSVIESVGQIHDAIAASHKDGTPLTDEQWDQIHKTRAALEEALSKAGA